MKGIHLKNIAKSYGKEQVFSNLNLEIPSGKFFALLGPSGCGKTTILRMIAGFEQPDSGSVMLGNNDITQQEANKRRVNTVFQNYALFPHLNVYDNIAYSLHLQKVAPKEVKFRVEKMLKMFRIEALKYKSVRQLSGGQQQRVAIARAVINKPDVLLLDEPLAALDLRLREQVLIELIELQEELGMTFIYVTHDQTEALTVADKMAIINQDGTIGQVGTPKEIYEFPASTSVARFVGSTNILQGSLEQEGDNCFMNIPGMEKIAVAKPNSWNALAGQETVFMSLRPEKIEISKKPLEGFSNHIIGKVDAIVYYGRSTQYTIELSNGRLIQVFEQNEEHFPKEVIDYDDQVHVHWQKENAVLLKY